jgi:hypothetical protein
MTLALNLEIVISNYFPLLYNNWLGAGQPSSRSSSPGKVKDFLFSM